MNAYTARVDGYHLHATMDGVHVGRPGERDVSEERWVFDVPLARISTTNAVTGVTCVSPPSGS